MNNEYKYKYYNGIFEILKIDYEAILKDFTIFKIDMDLKEFFGESICSEERTSFFKSVREIKNLNCSYLKGSLYLLGTKDCQAEKYNFVKSYVKGGVQRLGTKEELEKIDKLILLNLLVKYISFKIFKDETKKDVKYIDNRPLHLFLNEEKDIFRFFKVLFENSDTQDKYLLNLTQVTFAHINYFKGKNEMKLSKATKIGYNAETRVLIPNEKGKYYDRSPYSKSIESTFMLLEHTKVEKLRSYYFTLVKDVIDEYLSKYIILSFATLKDFELYVPNNKKNFFKKNIINLKKDINVYRIKDYDKDGNELIAEDNFLELKKQLENFDYGTKDKVINLDGINLISKGVATVDTKYEENSWNIFLLNNSTGDNLKYDGYKELKKEKNIISNGLCLTDIPLKISENKKNKGLKTIITRVIEELYIKESIQKGNISGLFSDVKIFKGISCLQYVDKRIRKIKVLSNGKIKVQSSRIYADDKLNKDFFKLIKKFELEDKLKKDEKKKTSTLDLKFININKKDIYIAETGMRLYFDTNEFLNEEDLNRKENGFFGLIKKIRLNKKENLYYSFYADGIPDTLTFSPNIKKIVCKEELTEEDYSIFCESLVFQYLSNTLKLATYPFFFKLTNEIIKDC